MTAAEIRALLLDAIYAPPAWGASAEEQERYAHRDLSRRPRAELARERERVRLRLLLDDYPDPWLLTRLERLGKAVDRAR